MGGFLGHSRTFERAPARGTGDETGTVERATEALVRRAKADGHFAFELEADATIPAE